VDLLKKATTLVIVNQGCLDVKKENILAKCGWSPFDAYILNLE
jgi:hypothetical protein